MANLYPYGGSSSHAHLPANPSMAPQFSGGDTQAALRFSTLMEQFIAQSYRPEKHPRSQIKHVLTAMAACFPTGSEPALWFADAFNVGSGVVNLLVNRPAAPIVVCWLAELGLSVLRSLTPTTNLAHALLYYEHNYRAITCLGYDDMHHRPVKLINMFISSHRRWFDAHPDRTGVVPGAKGEGGRDVLYTPEEAADNAEYTAAAFSVAAKQKQFRPDLAALDATRSHLIEIINTARDSLPAKWFETHQFLSDDSRNARLALDEFPSFELYATSAFRRQHCKAEQDEHELLLRCQPAPGESYSEWQPRFEAAVEINKPNPPLMREALTQHFIASAASRWGEKLRDYLTAFLANLPASTRTVDQLYQPARDFLKVHSNTKAHADTYNIPLPRGFSPSRARALSPAPSSSSGRTAHPQATRDSSRGRHVTFQAHRSETPEHRHASHHHDYYDLPAVHNTLSTSQGNNYCQLCARQHSTGVCWVDQPDRAPRSWRPPPDKQLFDHYRRRCKETGTEWHFPIMQERYVSPPAKPPRTFTFTSTPGSNPAARASATSGYQRQPTIVPTTSHAASYNQQPPPPQLQRQQEQEQRQERQQQQRPSARFAQADYWQEEEEECFGAYMADAEQQWAADSSDGGDGAEARPVTLRSGRVAGGMAPKPPDHRQPAARPRVQQQPPPEPFQHLPPPPAPTVAAPIPPAAAPLMQQLQQQAAAPTQPVIRHQPQPVPFAPTDLTPGLQPDQLPAVRQRGRVQQQQPPQQQRSLEPLLAPGVVLASSLHRSQPHLAEVPLSYVAKHVAAGSLAALMDAFPTPLVISGIGLEPIAVPLANVSVRMTAASFAALTQQAQQDGQQTADQPPPPQQQQQPQSQQQQQQPPQSQQQQQQQQQQPPQSQQQQQQQPQPQQQQQPPQPCSPRTHSSTQTVLRPGAGAAQPTAVSAAAVQAPSSSSQQPTVSFSWAEEPTTERAARAIAHLSPGAACITSSTAPKPTARIFSVPSVTYLEAENPQAGISVLLDGRIVACPRTMLDSGANVNLMTLDLATLCKIGFTTEQAISILGTSSSPNSTIGRVSAEVDIGLCLGTAGAITVRLPIHIVRSSKQQSWGLLLGTGFLNLIGASLDFYRSQLRYRPRLVDTPAPADDSEQDPCREVYCIPMVTTTDNPSPAYLADLLAPV